MAELERVHNGLPLLTRDEIGRRAYEGFVDGTRYALLDFRGYLRTEKEPDLVDVIEFGMGIMELRISLSMIPIVVRQPENDKELPSFDWSLIIIHRACSTELIRDVFRIGLCTDYGSDQMLESRSALAELVNKFVPCAPRVLGQKEREVVVTPMTQKLIDNESVPEGCAKAQETVIPFLRGIDTKGVLKAICRLSG